MITIYELSWGAGGHIREQRRYFRPENQTDAVVRLAERVLEMDRNPAIFAAWATLKRLPDSIYPEGLTLVSWTKTSDERPTEEGSMTNPCALSTTKEGGR